MTVGVRSMPLDSYVVNVRCVQIIRGSPQPYFGDIVETAQRRIMLAQLSTDEAKPGSREQWLRTYTDKLSALGIDMADGAIADIESASAHGTLADVVIRVLRSEGWDTEVTEHVKSALGSLENNETENQLARDAFDRAARDASIFEVQILSAEESGDLRIHSCWFSLATSQDTATIQDVFSLSATPSHLLHQYRISSGTLEWDFADRTTRVIAEKAASFYARNVRKLN
ncbi:hypothetical protein EDB89DRAFT_1357611 [Lactarius sanguifluus]|nr:hypothetical protein EDB89DRAFT_1357611 [Lactarius sanguifluus]